MIILIHNHNNYYELKIHIKHLQCVSLRTLLCVLHINHTLYFAKNLMNN